MATNARNFKKNPHTARWLMTFHTANGANYHPQAGAVDAAVEERKAMEFIGATGAAPTKEIFIQGWRILTGPGLISEAQAKWVVDIAETKEGVTDAMVKSLSERLIQGFARSAASAFITKYKDLPRKAAPSIEAKAEAVAPGASTEAYAASTVKPGRYAIVEDGVTKFYRVTEGKNRWAGRTFVEAQASDEMWPIRNATKRQEILAAIAADDMAERRYGMELGKCSRCGRTLTDETSRAYGIGPDCRNKM